MTTLLTWANGSFYDLYANNRTTGKPNLITADFIASSYALYKLSREQEVEKNVLQPRVINFVNYLYQGVVEMNLPNKKDALAYTAMLSLLAKDGKSINIPDGYETLQVAIGKEVKLVMSANQVAISPIVNKKIDYRVFKIPSKYQQNPAYFRTMKYAQTMPLNKKLKSAINSTIKASERLRNLEHYIKQIQEQFIGVEQKSNTLLSTYRGLDYYIFRESKKPSLQAIEKAINPKTSKNPMVQQRILNLYSSYDYDFKIMQTLIKNNYSNAFKGYYIQSQYRNMLYRTVFKTKSIHKESRTKANIEPRLEETLSVMIEGALVFSNSIKNNEIDKNMILTLKELRKVAQKKTMNMALNEKEINLLNSLDLVFLELTGLKDKPISVKVTNQLSLEILSPRRVTFGNKQMGNFSFGGRFVFR